MTDNELGTKWYAIDEGRRKVIAHKVKRNFDENMSRDCRTLLSLIATTFLFQQMPNVQYNTNDLAQIAVSASGSISGIIIYERLKNKYDIFEAINGVLESEGIMDSREYLIQYMYGITREIMNEHFR